MSVHPNAVPGGSVSLGSWILVSGTVLFATNSTVWNANFDVLCWFEPLRMDFKPCPADPGWVDSSLRKLRVNTHLKAFRTIHAHDGLQNASLVLDRWRRVVVPTTAERMLSARGIILRLWSGQVWAEVQMPPGPPFLNECR